jgi:hypothetical protein
MTVVVARNTSGGGDERIAATVAVQHDDMTVVAMRMEP